MTAYEAYIAAQKEHGNCSKEAQAALIQWCLEPKPRFDGKAMAQAFRNEITPKMDEVNAKLKATLKK